MLSKSSCYKFQIEGYNFKMFYVKFMEIIRGKHVVNLQKNMMTNPKNTDTKRHQNIKIDIKIRNEE